MNKNSRPRKTTYSAFEPTPGSAHELERFVKAVDNADFHDAMETISVLTPSQIKALRKDRSLLERISDAFELLDAVAILDVFGRGSVDPLTAYGGLTMGSSTSSSLEEDEDPEDPEERSEIIEDGELRATSRTQAVFAEYLTEQRVPVMEQLELTGVLENNTDWEVFFRIVNNFSALDRQIALVEVRKLDLWNELLAQMDENSDDVLQSWLEDDLVSPDIDALRKEITRQPNGRQGLLALDAVIRVRDDASESSSRLPLRLQELVANAVATSQGRRQGLALRGYLGPQQAERAARALVTMPASIYLRFLLQLLMTPIPARFAQSGVLLKALAARLTEFSDPDDAVGAIEDLEGFADDIRELHGTDLLRAISVLQVGEVGAPGLQQRFSVGCNVTAAIVIRAEADPMEAFRLNHEHQLLADVLQGQVAMETAECLEKHSDNSAIPREPSRLLSRLHATILSNQDDVPTARLMAIRDHLAGKAPRVGDLRAGLAAIQRTASQPALFQDDLLHIVRETDISSERPGLDPWQLAEECNKTLGYEDILGRQMEVVWSDPLWHAFNDDCEQGRAVDRQLPRPLPAEWTAWCTALVDFAAERLLAGQDVLLQVYWEGAGGRTVSLHDIQIDDGQRVFLVHDTCVGVTSWWSESQILDGNCPTFGRRGLLCAIIG